MHYVWPRMAHYNPYIIFDKIVLKERGGGLKFFNAKLQTSMDIRGIIISNWPGRVFILFQTNECEIVIHLVFLALRWMQYIPGLNFLCLCEMKANSRIGYEHLTIRYMGFVLHIVPFTSQHWLAYIGGWSMNLPGYGTTWPNIQ